MDSFPVQEELLMHRFYADPNRSTPDTIVLTPEDTRHALTVLRLKPGHHIEIILNHARMEAVIEQTEKQKVTARCITVLPSTEPSLSVTLFQGLPKADKMDLIVQKATELGVNRIIPVLMNRCIVRPDLKDTAHKTERWQKIAREAGKQSGRCVIPEVFTPVSLNSLNRIVPFPEKNVVPWEEATGFGPLALRNSAPAISSLGILIGPEGGIEEAEIELLRSIGFIPITLGKRILRTETAGLAAVSSMMSLYGEME